MLSVATLTGALGAGAQSNPAPAPQSADRWPTKDGWVTLRDFKFGSGETLPELKLHYLTLGAAHRNGDGRVETQSSCCTARAAARTHC